MVAGTTECGMWISFHRVGVYLRRTHVGCNTCSKCLLGFVVVGMKLRIEVGFDLILCDRHMRIGGDDSFAGAVQDDVGFGDGHRYSFRSATQDDAATAGADKNMLSSGDLVRRRAP